MLHSLEKCVLQSFIGIPYKKGFIVHWFHLSQFLRNENKKNKKIKKIVSDQKSK